MTAQAIPLRERKKRAMHQNIHTHVCSLIRQQGLAALTIDSICRSTGITKKTFYNHFPSRHQLLLSICQTLLLDSTQILVKHVTKETQTLEQRLELFFAIFKRRFVQRDKLERELIAFLVTNFADHRDEGGHMHQQMVNTYMELFHSNHGELATGLDCRFCAEITVGMVSTITLNWLSHENSQTREQLDNLYLFINNTMLDSTRPE